MAQAQQSTRVAYRDEELESVQVQGVTEEYLDFTTFDAERGRMIIPVEIRRKRHVALVGWQTADRLFGTDYQWSILAAGRHQMNLITIGATMGGNVRVGLEDNLYLPDGSVAKSNGEAVAKAVELARLVGVAPASVAEAREVLQLPRKVSA